MDVSGLLALMVALYQLLREVRGDCVGVVPLPVSEDDRQTILATHNAFRQRVASGEEPRGSPGPQPPAVNMPDLVWDDNLAYAAEAWTQNCLYAHDPKLNDLGMGQNIARLSTSILLEGPDWVGSAISPWYDEVSDVDCNTVGDFTGQPGLDGREIGHYTQVVWATTTAVGCAAIGYTEGDPNTTVMPYQQLYVCNYGPPGNYIGSPVYIVDPNRLFATCPPTTTSPPLTINNSMGIFN